MTPLLSLLVPSLESFMGAGDLPSRFNPDTQKLPYSLIKID